mmetsp:Transcript_39417/g.80837  ORF Transcript_39417/g.80837 Transcript_39417/m.80837 type:complete len:312 (-) Transcript_39417:1463-2398(-)
MPRRYDSRVARRYDMSDRYADDPYSYGRDRGGYDRGNGDRDRDRGDYYYGTREQPREKSGTYKPLFAQRFPDYQNSRRDVLGGGRSSGRLSDEGKERPYSLLPPGGGTDSRDQGRTGSTGRLSDMGKSEYGGGSARSSQPSRALTRASSSGGSSADGYYDRYGRWQTGNRDVDRVGDYGGRSGGSTGRLSDLGRTFTGPDRYGRSYEKRGYRSERLSDVGKDEEMYHRSRGRGRRSRDRDCREEEWERRQYGEEDRRRMRPPSDHMGRRLDDDRPKYYGGITPTSDYDNSRSSTFKPLFGPNKKYLNEGRR